MSPINANRTMMKMTNDNATIVNQLTRYLQGYTKASLNLMELFDWYDSQELTDDQRKLFDELYASFLEIVETLHREL